MDFPSAPARGTARRALTARRGRQLRSVQRRHGGRGSARICQSLRDGAGGDHLEARRQPIFERKQPTMAEVEEPGFPALGDLSFPTILTRGWQGPQMPR
jgi:hypothetical protein